MTTVKAMTTLERGGRPGMFVRLQAMASAVPPATASAVAVTAKNTVFLTAAQYAGSANRARYAPTVNTPPGR